MGQIPNSPLVEAIFELRWGETSNSQFKFSIEEAELLPGVFLKTIKDQGYGVSEQVNHDPGRPAFPFEIKHRFRKSHGTWPCFQIGLGIFTANEIGNASLDGPDKDQYDWDTFKPSITTGLDALNSSLNGGLPSLENPTCILRYQDAFKLKGSETLESFISDKIKADISVENFLGNNEKIAENADELQLNFSYKTKHPEGRISITLSSALIHGKKGIVIDTSISSKISEESMSTIEISNWAEQAHDLQRYVFETLIKTSEL